MTGTISAGGVFPSPRSASRSRPAAALPPPLSRVSPSLCSGVGVREAKILLLNPHHVRSDQRASGTGVGHQEQPRAVGHHLLPLDARYRDRARHSSRSAGTPRPLASSTPAPLSRVPGAWPQCPTLPVPGLVPVPPAFGHPRSVPIAPLDLSTSLSSQPFCYLHYFPELGLGTPASVSLISAPFPCAGPWPQ